MAGCRPSATVRWNRKYRLQHADEHGYDTFALGAALCTADIVRDGLGVGRGRHDDNADADEVDADGDSAGAGPRNVSPTPARRRSGD